MRVLMITPEWPTETMPNRAPFLVQQVESLRQAGLDVDVFHYAGRQNPLNYWRGWREVRRCLHARAYELIHAQFGQSGLLALGSGLPLVITFRGSDVLGFPDASGRYTFKGRVLSAVSQLLARHAAQAIVVSAHLIAHLPPRDYHIIPSGLNLALFKPGSRHDARQQLGLPLDQKLVLFSSLMNNPIKRYPLAKAAVDLVPEAQIVLATNVQPADMPLYMQACDVLVLTSMHEGSPNVVKEALACNLKVVSVDVGDVRERIAGLPGCVVCENDHPETIAAGLRAALAYVEPFDGRSTVASLDQSTLTQQLISVYKQVAHGQ
jgi:teichuronic acid biosynthesis glycosyltransferase TuaC